MSRVKKWDAFVSSYCVPRCEPTAESSTVVCQGEAAHFDGVNKPVRVSEGRKGGVLLEAAGKTHNR